MHFKTLPICNKLYVQNLNISDDPFNILDLYIIMEGRRLYTQNKILSADSWNKIKNCQKEANKNSHYKKLTDVLWQKLTVLEVHDNLLLTEIVPSDYF